ncbi:hypothetical protein BJ165DRAFT_1508306 [Panaeolus papilionaceus]|nr:hypothetical protein BJ165DRAFT_1508306 [Panaeolus papilionaceus]
MCHVITSTCALATFYSIFYLFSPISGHCFPVLSLFFISSLFSPHYLFLVPFRFFSPFIPSILLFLASLI